MIGKEGDGCTNELDLIISYYLHILKTALYYKYMHYNLPINNNNNIHISTQMQQIVVLNTTK